MVLKKTIVSVAFLLTYTLGLAHEIIPHCHHNEVGQHSQLFGQSNRDFHEVHCATDHQCASGVDAQGLLHQVIALMSETDHPTTCAELSLYLPSIAHDINPLSLFKLIAIAAIYRVFLFSFYAVKTLNSQAYQPPAYTPPPLSDTSLRGPPFFSC